MKPSKKYPANIIILLDEGKGKRIHLIIIVLLKDNFAIGKVFVY